MLLVLAGVHAVLCLASVAELSWAYGWYFTMFLELGYVPTSTGRFQILHVEANIRKT